MERESKAQESDLDLALDRRGQGKLGATMSGFNSGTEGERRMPRSATIMSTDWSTDWPDLPPRGHPAGCRVVRPFCGSFFRIDGRRQVPVTSPTATTLASGCCLSAD